MLVQPSRSHDDIDAPSHRNPHYLKRTRHGLRIRCVGLEITERCEVAVLVTRFRRRDGPPFIIAFNHAAERDCISACELFFPLWSELTITTTSFGAWIWLNAAKTPAGGQVSSIRPRATSAGHLIRDAKLTTSK